mgnify:CR=1 FL=1
MNLFLPLLPGWFLSWRGRFIFGVAVASLVAGLSAQTPSPFVWTRATPEEQGIDSRGIAQLLAQTQRENIALHSFLLVRHGQLVAEAYRYPYTADTRHILYSASKSFTSALVGIAIEQGLLAGVEERVVDIFPDELPATVSANLSQMRLKHLLTMSTGHAADTTSRITYTSDWVRAYLALPVENPPGTQFIYNSGATAMLSAAIQKRSGMNALAFAERNLFPALNITSYSWDVGPNNLTTGGWGLYLAPRDMAKFGQLYLQNGRFNGQQVVPAAWVAASSRWQVDSNNVNPFWGSGYGYQFWLNDFGGYRADGAYAQYIFILPEYDAVIVFTSNLSDSEMPARLVRQWLLPAMQDAALPANPAAALVIARSAEVLQASTRAGPTAPVFTTLPADLVVPVNQSVALTAQATGSPTPTYQWYKDGAPIAGGTSATLALGAATEAITGDYQVVASNPSGTLASYPVKVALRWSQLAAISARAVAGTGEQSLILGFACAGAGAKSMLLRGVGPGLLLGDTSLTGRILANPQLILHDMDHGTVAAQNDDWGGADELVAAFARTGTGPLAVGSTDAAMLQPLSQHLYTVQVASADGATGVALAEAYDADLTNKSRRLQALSVRNQVGAEADSLIAGFVILGNGPMRLLVRGVGPGLVPAVTRAAVLQDPQLVLRRYLKGRWETVATNDNWGGGTTLAAAFRTAGVSALPADSLDAALLVDLPPGIYTAQLTGVGHTTGVGLVEVYQIAAP